MFKNKYNSLPFSHFITFLNILNAPLSAYLGRRRYIGPRILDRVVLASAQIGNLNIYFVRPKV